MNEAEAKKLLSDDGYTNIYSWFESPETEYEEHVHPNDRTYVILEGMMTVGMHGVETDYQAGDRFSVAAHELHTTVFGPEGCFYLIGEK